MQRMKAVNIAVVGCGYWGRNLARSLYQLGVLAMVCDIDPARHNIAAKISPNIRITSNFEDVFSKDINGVVIATPAHTHYSLAQQALKKGKHVLVEKPLALTSSECSELINIASEQKRKLMVGHTFLYNAAVWKMKQCISSEDFGDIYYIYSSRLNFGKIRSNINAMWNFAPHDISILMYLLGQQPCRVSARGFSYIQAGIDDIVFMTLDFAGSIRANIHISWLNPQKVRQMAVVGSRRMVMYDDTNPEARIMVYDKGMAKKPDKPSLGDFETFDEFQLLLRAGNVHIPNIDFIEPIRVECSHFIDCINNGDEPLTSGHTGLQVVRVLEAAQRSLDRGGVPQEIQN